MSALDRLPPLSDDLRDWLDGGRSTGQGLTRSSGTPVGEDAPLVELGTRLVEVARLALGAQGDGAQGVGVWLDGLPDLPGLIEPTVWGVVQWLLTHGANGGQVSIKRLIAEDLTVAAGFTTLARNSETAPGVTVTVEPTGELLSL